MSKYFYLSVLFVVAVASVNFVSADNDATKAKPEIKAVKKTVTGINHGAAKGAQLVQSGTKSVKSKVENFVNKPSGEGTIAGSLVRGVGRLLRNVTVETGRFSGTVGKGAVQLGKSTKDATADAVIRSANRAKNLRRSKSRPEDAASEKEPAPADE